MEKWRLGVGLAHEFEIMANKNGWANVDFSRLATDEALNRKVLAVLRGQADIVTAQHLIDLDAAPFMPEGWSVEEHVKGGTLAWDPSRVRLYLDKGQESGKYIEGHKLRKALKGQRVLNANVLDHLLANPYLIPDEWKGEAVFFWGTVYRDAGGFQCVRFLRWEGGGWGWYCYSWLGGDWRSGGPAAVLAS